MTFSIVARSADARVFGVAIASSSPAVAARCMHARAGIGAVTSQNITDPALGRRVLDALEHGAEAQSALIEALSTTPFGPYRQLTAIGGSGAPAAHSGERALGCVSAAVGDHSAAAGNLLARPSVPGAMVRRFEEARGHMGERLMRALRAGLDEGGEAGPVHSAGLMVVHDVSWPIVDLRVDWTEGDPVAQLHAIWELYAPQIEDYVRRALDPESAPTFAVSGDL